ncbi:MAG TPA: hypothetical protein VFZ14_19510 [Burkholderiales bacterium]|nr:hypothetical protein [Burkholderiales bacterium]
MNDSRPTGSSATYRCGAIEIDAAQRQVLIDGAPARIGARAFAVLIALVERRERVGVGLGRGHSDSSVHLWTDNSLNVDTGQLFDAPPVCLGRTSAAPPHAYRCAAPGRP